uniref:Hint domain-containing protein n=1 Tax=Plectus sambesii TaxID=2011161 RepID=A0A914VVA8_9BILA
MPCIPDPPEQYNLVDDGVEENLELALVEEEVPANVASEKSDGGEISSNRPPLFAEPLVPGPIGQQLVPLPPFVQGPAQVAPINFYPAQSAVAYQYYTTTTTPFLCFSADTMVATTNGEKRMDELRIGDVVRTSIATGATFVPIVSFLHRLPEAKANFVRIQTDDDSVLKLTPLHLIQIATFPTMSGLEPSGKLVKAEDVKVGDHLFRLNNNGTKFKLVNVTRITVVSETGAFAPLTSNGYIVVNNLVASCHSVSHATVVQQTFFAHLRLLEEVFWKLFGLHAIDDEGMVELPTGTITIVKWLQYIVPSIPLFSVQ